MAHQRLKFCRLRSALAGLLLSLMFVSLQAQETQAVDEAEFQRWLAELIDEARERGVDENLIDTVLRPVTPIPQVVSNDRSQAEFVETLEMYLERRVTDWRINTGRERLARHRELLQEVAAEYNVQPRFIVAIWGIETNYGNFTGGTDVIRALVTLAFDPRRSDFFRRELFAALQILEEGHIEPAQMQGSWAGAMGQSQFMPSSFLDYAVDFDGDGRRDIWNSPGDVFASIANYLRQAGWDDTQTWGREVQLPDAWGQMSDQFEQGPIDVSCSVLRNHTVQLPLSQWQEHGVRRADGSDLPGVDFPSSIIQPDGDGGRAFVTYDNFRAILRYNCANSYALAVSHLADHFIGH